MSFLNEINIIILKSTFFSIEKKIHFSFFSFLFFSTFKINLDKIVGVNLACSHVQYMYNENYAYNLSSSFLTGMKYHLIKIPLFHYDDNDDNNNNNNNNNDNGKHNDDK